MKRKREEELVSDQSKRQSTCASLDEDDDFHIEHPDDADATSTAAAPSASAASYVDFEGELDTESLAGSTPATTITRAGGGVRTDDAASTTTKSRKIFPSMLKTLKCTHPGCDKTFNRPVRLAAHMRTHVGDRAIKCPHEGCDKAYFHDKDLKHHLKGSHGGEDGDGSAARRYACEVPGCDKAFLTATRLRRHAVVHSDEGRFPCKGYEGCDRVFRKRQTLQRHIRADHLDQSAYLCSHEGCEAGFDTSNALRRHVDREHGEVRFWCEECGKASAANGAGSGSGSAEAMPVGFTTMARLMQHMRNAHVDCMFCDARCGSQWELERHIEVHHSGTTAEDRKVISCTRDGCGKKFTRRANLNVHIKTAHEGHRFVCGEIDVSATPDLESWDRATQGCGADFASKKRLEDHIRVAHLKMELPKPIRTVRLDDDGSTTAAGFFNMYASVAPATLDYQPQQTLRQNTKNETATAGAPLAEVPDPLAQPTMTYPCGHPGCLQSFAAVDDLETHVNIFHLVQQELEDISPDATVFSALHPSSPTDVFSYPFSDPCPSHLLYGNIAPQNFSDSIFPHPDPYHQQPDDIAALVDPSLYLLT